MNSMASGVKKKTNFAVEQVMKEQRYSSTLSLTSALDGSGWLTPRPDRFTPGKESGYPSYRRLGGPQGRSGRVRDISLPPGFDSQSAQHVMGRYTNYAITTPYGVRSIW
jgi:hypothetical protein